MIPRPFSAALLLLLGAATFVTAALAARPDSDIPPPEKRRLVLDQADRLAHPPAAAPLPAKLPQPFSPADFEGSGAAAPTGQPHAAVAPAPLTDRQLLETLADKIPTTGTIIMGHKALLVIGVNRIEVGSRFTVVYKGQQYELELVDINRTSFTVRYKGESFTRPIRLTRSP